MPGPQTQQEASSSHNISPSVFSSAANVRISNTRSSANDSNNIKYEVQFGGIKEEQSNISSSEDFNSNREASNDVSEQIRGQVSRDLTSDQYRCRF